MFLKSTQITEEQWGHLQLYAVGWPVEPLDCELM